MGADTWRHASSIAGISNTKKRFCLTPSGYRSRHRLSVAPQNTAVTPLAADLAERRKEDPFKEHGQIITLGINDWNGLAFVSAPPDQNVQFNGLFRGDFNVVANKKDFDFEVDLCE